MKRDRSGHVIKKNGELKSVHSLFHFDEENNSLKNYNLLACPTVQMVETKIMEMVETDDETIKATQNETRKNTQHHMKIILVCFEWEIHTI